MPSNGYWDDTLAWSERQALLLRRLAAGERGQLLPAACPASLDESLAKDVDVAELVTALSRCGIGRR